ncbi:MAG: phosphoadenosine phosphosulfate reductase family protein [Thermoplasmata archaeon]|nr:phosphoadenosine phosphosulfate reductase family protein [Thermoplasmata archaeon]
MGEIRHGKIHLRWCDACDVPVMEQASCGRCGGPTREVKVTPPGDARPAFEMDIHRVKALIDSQFGEGTGEAVVPAGAIALLNKAPDIDRMDEVIVGGDVVGAVRFNMVSGEKFLPRPLAAVAMAATATRGRVVVDPGAIVPIRTKKASTLAVGVLRCDDGIRPGDETIVIAPDGMPVSVGLAKMSSEQMRRGERGTAVKTRWVVEEGTARRTPRAATWGDAVSASRETMARREDEATRFVKKVVAENDLPVAVSYSGGKDSLATLLLVLESGVRPKLMFVDTGLEFAETRENVAQVTQDFGLELVSESAGESFWQNLELFGPPARDFRWCCKTCKLGPATRLIQREFPGGVLSFIGQRAYESEQRASKGRVWRNPWTPGQLAASPIQKWTAMHVWLYLLGKGARVNPLYSQGFERIGCFMCPAADLAELNRARELGEQFPRWQGFLDGYAERRGLKGPWLSYDVWRWKRLPPSVTEELRLGGVVLPEGGPRDPSTGPLEFRSTQGYGPCVEGLSMEGVFSKPLDMQRVSNLLSVIGPVAQSPDGNIAEVRGITVFAEGPVMIKAKDEHELRSKAAKLREVVLRAMDCAGCGICVARCENRALRLEGRVVIDEPACTHCGQCLGPCPVVSFREDDLDI